MSKRERDGGGVWVGVGLAAEAPRRGGGSRGSKTAEREVQMSKKERRERGCCEGHCEWHCEGGRRRRKGNGKGEE